MGEDYGQRVVVYDTRNGASRAREGRKDGQ